MFGLPNSQTADKAKLRRDMRVLRRKLLDDTPEASRRAALRLPASRFSRFPVVAAYCVQGTELDPGPILRAILELGGGRTKAALPVAVDRKSPLRFRLWTPDQVLIPDACGIPSPPPSAPELHPNLLITPLLAFDRAGGRLGQGGGHYDRTLAALRKRRPVFVLGVAFAGQEIPSVPMAAHDQRLDAIVTETEFIEIVKKAP